MLVLSAMAVVVGAASMRAQAPTWVILVRHAEKAATPANDPDLTPAGIERAKALMDRLEFTKLSAILTTQFRRTQMTAAFTAKQHHLPPEVIPTTAPDHVQAVVDRIKAMPGRVILVVGHSNTVPDIIAALGAPKPKAICDDEYDNFDVVMVPATGAATVVQTRYGAPSGVDAACTAMK